MKNLIYFFLAALITKFSFAGDVSRKGTTGAEQLLIPVGARSIATSGAFLANTSGVEAIYYNPAGLTRSKKSEAMFSFMSYIADIKVSYFAIGAYLNELGSIGLSFKTFDFGNIPVTTNESPDGTGSFYSPSFYTTSLTYSRLISDRVSVGVNFKLIHEGIMNTSADGVALDFGVQYFFYSYLSLGVSVKNIGSNMSYSGQDLQVKTEIPNTNSNTKLGAYSPVTEEFQIPSYFELSVCYNYNINEQNNLLVGSTFRNNNSMEDQMKIGLEYSFAQIFHIRSGYDYLIENQANSIFGFSFGAGVEYSFGDGVEISLDYAFRDLKQFPQPNHIFTMQLSLE